MSDVVERAKAALVDYEVAKGSRVAVAPGRSYRLLAELVAEVERLRPRGVETTADLEWLPEDSVILTHDGGTLQKTSRGTWYWANDDQDESLPGNLIDFLPARVLYIPTDSLEEA
uniref:HNH endonuclease n=1 Tax=Mycobacterium phage LilBib TaxID=3136622 RepID=A0AAU8GLY0_9VIRU